MWTYIRQEREEEWEWWWEGGESLSLSLSLRDLITLDPLEKHSESEYRLLRTPHSQNDQPPSWVTPSYGHLVVCRYDSIMPCKSNRAWLTNHTNASAPGTARYKTILITDDLLGWGWGKMGEGEGWGLFLPAFTQTVPWLKLIAAYL